MEKNDKKLKKLYDLAVAVYNLSVVVKDFYEIHKDEETITNIYPLIKYLNDRADLLSYSFCNMFFGDEEI